MAQASPPPESPTPASEVLHLQRVIAQLTVEGAKPATWADELTAVAVRIEALVDRDRDAALYLLAQDAQRNLGAYSSRHALYCAAVALLCCRELGWPAEEARLLVLASLTMNLGMVALQDELSFRERTPTVDQRRAVENHPVVSVEQLREAGIEDALWLEVVARHHEDVPADTKLADLDPAVRLAALLHRADVFTAKLSARQTRAAMPATAAARDACLGPNGRPDELGASVIKALGIYPPGSYVKLASGEIAVVKRRGAKANEPLVLSLVGRDGKPLAPPVPRHTGQAEHAVRSTARPIDTRLIAGHLRAAAYD